MPFQVAPWVPMALGSAAARGAHRLYRWADTEYINPNPRAPSTSVKPAMARRTRTMTTFRRRKTKRRRRGIIRRRIPRALAPTEKVIRAKLVDTFTSAGGAGGALETRLVSVMNIPDPTSGHTNQQFLGYDEWKALYRKGVVLGIKLTVQVHNKGSVGMLFGVTPMPENQNNTALTTHEHYMELSQTKSFLLSPDVDRGVIVYKMGTRRWLHVKSLRDEDAFHSVLAAETEPTRTFWITTWFQPIDAATQCAYECVITYEFLIRLFDPIVPARSTDT